MEGHKVCRYRLAKREEHLAKLGRYTVIFGEEIEGLGRAIQRLLRVAGREEAAPVSVLRVDWLTRRELLTHGAPSGPPLHDLALLHCR